MKLSARIAKKAAEDLAKIRGIARHKQAVMDNCMLLAEKLIEAGRFDTGRRLFVAGYTHDNSKFFGIEWDEMAPGTTCEDEHKKLKLRTAISNHNRTNPHHPEYWGTIHQMPELETFEMVCDFKARAEGFGSSLTDYINNEATKRWKFSKEDAVYKTIMYAVNLLCEKPFGAV